MANRKFIFDFDSTFVQVECFDELHKYAVKEKPDLQPLIDDFAKMTDQAMNGQFSFRESLDLRINAIPLTQKQIQTFAQRLTNFISPSFMRNMPFFEAYKDDIYIFSGGFIEFIWPVAKMFGLHYEHIFANQFLYNHEGVVVDFDRNNPLSQDKGKVMLLQKLNLEGDICVIGDGYNDYEMKEAGLAHTFFAYTENVQRENVCNVADGVFSDLEGIFLACNIETKPIPKKKKALLLENVHPYAINHLKSYGFEVETRTGSLTEKELIEALDGVSLLGVRSKSPITKEVIASSSTLEAVGAFCIGTNHIDIEACLNQGIGVFNAPFSNTRSVVELALGHIIMLMRKVFEKNAKLHDGKWEKSATQCHEVRGKTLGIIGYGNIGSQLSVLAENLGMQVLFYDLEEKLPLGNAQSCHHMHELLEQSDIVSLHVDGRASNHNLIDSKALAAMKEHSYLINLSRGHVVDLEALEVSLKKGHLLGAAIDVFPKEPKSNDEPFTMPLQGLKQVALTPHIGGSTQEAQFNIGQFVAHRLQEFSQLGSTVNCVNLPQLQLPAIQGSHRIIHTHQNVPGILAKINSLLAEYNINIEGQYLKTNERVGYVITDVNVLDGASFVDRLKAIDHTISVRVLY